MSTPASGATEFDLGLTVSDGRDIGNSVSVRIETFVLRIFAVNNTGLVVPAGASGLLTSYNLTFTTNAPEQSLNLRYRQHLLPPLFPGTILLLPFLGSSSHNAILAKLIRF